MTRIAPRINMESVDFVNGVCFALVEASRNGVDNYPLSQVLKSMGIQSSELNEKFNLVKYDFEVFKEIIKEANINVNFTEEDLDE